MFGVVLFVAFVCCAPCVFAEDYSMSIVTSGSVNLTSNSGNTDIESSDIHVTTTCRSQRISMSRLLMVTLLS